MKSKREKKGFYRGGWMLCSLFFILGVFGNVGQGIVGEVLEYFRDKVPPVLSIQNEKYEIFVGEEIPELAEVTAVDDRDGEVLVECSQVEISRWKAGNYTSSCFAEDRAGNRAEATREIQVIGKSNGGVVYLTFDDGPFDYTQTLLDVLAKYDVRATFFVTGKGEDADILREYQEGHSVGLHSFSHSYSDIYSGEGEYFDDLRAISDRVYNITGERSRLVRFPGGSSNTVSRRYSKGIMSRLAEEVEARGYRYFDWNVTSGDAGEVYTTEEVYQNVVSRLYPGGEFVVLQHDVKDFSVAAVEEIIRYGLSEGYEFRRIEVGAPEAHHRVNN